MTKPWLLIVLGIFLTALLGLWLYLFLGGDEAREDLFATFGLGETVGEFPADSGLPNESGSSTTPILRQLSLRPVIGYQEVGTSTNRSVYIAEAGTGHIYRISTATGAEERVSNHTVAMASEAVFSEDGTNVAILSNESNRGIVLASGIGTASSTITTVPVSAVSISFLKNGSLVYALRTNHETVAFSHSETTTEIFRVPFREAKILWGGTAAGPHLVYPKTSVTLEGYLYSITNKKLSRLPLAGFGFSALTDDSASVIFSFRKRNDVLESTIYKGESGVREPAAVTALPEKCVFGVNADTILCAVANVGSVYSSQFPDSWYEGRDGFVDSLWSISTKAAGSRKIIDLIQSGRNIDAVNLSVSSDGQVSYFINRIDNTLWIYDRDFTSVTPDNQ